MIAKPSPSGQVTIAAKPSPSGQVAKPSPATGTAGSILDGETQLRLDMGPPRAGVQGAKGPLAYTEWEPDPDYQYRGLHLETLRARLPLQFMLKLADLSEHQARFNLRRLSLTLPNHELNTIGPRDAAESLAHGIARERRDVTGALLVLDVSPKGRPHWFGLAVTQRADHELDQLWYQLVRHVPTRAHIRKRVVAVTGQDTDWSEQTDKLRRNVIRCCRYALKPLPPSHRNRWPLSARLIATGPFVDVLALAGNVTERHCGYCGRDISHLRGQARFCGGTHRKLASKGSDARKATRKRLA